MRLHCDIPALPFSLKRKIVARPKPEGYPNVLKTIGDHIRAWRMDNYLTQAELAGMLRVCEDTIVGWEMRGTIPTIGQMPGIMAAIGYLPLDIDISTLGGKVRYYRYVNGMSQEDMAKELGVNESTVFHFEKGTHKPSTKTFKKLEGLLKSIKPRIFKFSLKN